MTSYPKALCGKFLPVLIATITIGLSACGGTGVKTEFPPTKAIIHGVSNWGFFADITGEVSEPKFPVSIPVRQYDTTFASKIVTEAFSISGYIVVGGLFKITDGDGFLSSPLFFADWRDHPDDLSKRQWEIVGTYSVARNLSHTNPDLAHVEVDYFGPPGFVTSKGQAILPWKLNSQSSTINGSSIVSVDEQVWVQATATGLPAPITYLWKLDGVTLPGVNQSFYTTQFGTPGSRWFEVRMTGSNGQFVIRNFLVTVPGSGGCLVCEP